MGKSCTVSCTARKSKEIVDIKKAGLCTQTRYLIDFNLVAKTGVEPVTSGL
jgi:hypothetical protein